MSRIATGLSAIGLAIAFNIPFSLLAANFSYPDILRRPAAEVLAAFAAGGPTLVLTWLAFSLSALAMIPVATALAFHHDDWMDRPTLAIGGAITGALAGLTQAIGLSRWVFAVPHFARVAVDPAASLDSKLMAETAFDLLNLWGGVGIGEHLGQILTCLWVLHVALTQAIEGGWLNRITALVGALTIAGIGFGLGEGIAIAMGQPGDMFSLGTVAGYIALTLWLILTGIAVITNRRAA